MLVIAQAGGVAASGSDNVVVIRGQQTIKVNLSQLVSETDPVKRNIMLSSGDVVYVPRSMIFVYGEVNRPGNFRLESDMTMMQAISVAGGFTQRASRGSVVIHRRQPDGTVVTRDGRLNDKLLPGDVVEVPESWF